MICLLLWLIYLRTYSDTEHALNDSIRRCDHCGVNGLVVNMGFIDKDRILMKHLYDFKGYGAKKLIKEFLNECWRPRGLNELSKKLQKKLARRKTKRQH